MSEKKEISSKLIITFLVILLVVVLTQSWYMFDMHKKLSAVQSNGSVAVVDEAIPKTKTGPDSPRRQVKPAPFNSSPLKNDWYNEPFDADDWDPYQEIQQMQDHMNQVFGNAFGRFDRSPNYRHLFNSSSFSPNIDMEESEQDFVIKIDLPGVSEQNLDINIEDQVLTISGHMEQRDKTTDDEGRVIRRERHSGRFSRSITLPVPVKPEAMTSRVDNGVLVIKIPKS